jgi:hypothetical protein
VIVPKTILSPSRLDDPFNKDEELKINDFNRPTSSLEEKWKIMIFHIIREGLNKKSTDLKKYRVDVFIKTIFRWLRKFF